MNIFEYSNICPTLLEIQPKKINKYFTDKIQLNNINSTSSVQYRVSYNLQEAGKGLSLREKVSLASHFDVWLQLIVQYSVQCTSQCTMYYSVQDRCVGCLGTQWDVTLQPVKTRTIFYCQKKRKKVMSGISWWLIFPI